MTRHARNCTAGAVYTYHEKKKDAAESGYGTRAERLGKQSLNHFDCCCLTLQPCRTPVVTREGHLFDKEAILEYIISKKTEYARNLKKYEKQMKTDEAEQEEQKIARKEAELMKMMKQESSIAHANNQPSSSKDGKDKHLPSFWVPSQLPDAQRSRCEKPDPTVYCPVSGKPLKAKDLIAVKWTLLSDDKSLISQEERYKCAVTGDILGNSVPCAVIRTTGDVVTMECVERLIKPTWTHPLTGEKLKEKDIIRLQRGGTGYAATNAGLEGQDRRPALQA